jgi:hypothetical protein
MSGVRQTGDITHTKGYPFAEQPSPIQRDSRSSTISSCIAGFASIFSKGIARLRGRRLAAIPQAPRMRYSLEQDISCLLALLLILLVLLVLLQHHLTQKALHAVHADDYVCLDDFSARERHVCLLLVHRLHACPVPHNCALRARGS